VFVVWVVPQAMHRRNNFSANDSNENSNSDKKQQAPLPIPHSVQQQQQQQQQQRYHRSWMCRESGVFN
jgi:hypothetical protein